MPPTRPADSVHFCLQELELDNSWPEHIKFVCGASGKKSWHSKGREICLQHFFFFFSFIYPGDRMIFRFLWLALPAPTDKLLNHGDRGMNGRHSPRCRWEENWLIIFITHRWAATPPEARRLWGVFWSRTVSYTFPSVQESAMLPPLPASCLQRARSVPPRRLKDKKPTNKKPPKTNQNKNPTKFLSFSKSWNPVRPANIFWKEQPRVSLAFQPYSSIVSHFIALIIRISLLL